MKLIALVFLMSLVAKYFLVYAKKRVRIENCLSAFAVLGVVNMETFTSFIRLPF